MSEFAISVPKYGNEPPQRKRKLEFPGSSASAVSIRILRTAEYDSSDEDDDIVSAIEEEYSRQVRESGGFDVDNLPLPCGGLFPFILEDMYDYSYEMGLLARLGLHCFNLEKGTNLKLNGIYKSNHQMWGCSLEELITLEAMDTSSNSLCDFQTCVCQDILGGDSSLTVWTEISRLRVPSSPGAAPVGPQRGWNEDAIDDSYKGKMPSWLTEEELAAVSNNKWQFYELQGNEWLQMYAEFAFYVKCGKHLVPRTFLPLEMKKIIVQTKENIETCMDLKANNAIFYISFKANGDPSGIPVECQAIVRRTMDGKPGHIRLEVECSRCPQVYDPVSSIRETHSGKLVASITDKHTCLPDSSISDRSAHSLSPRTRIQTTEDVKDEDEY